MLKKTITYTDYNDVERTEDFYFNLSKAELSEMQMGTTGGLANMLQKMIQTKDNVAIIRMFKEILLKSYGEKSDDGKRFIKSEELSKAFSETEAYSVLFMELCENETTVADFIKGVLPADLAKKVEEEQSKGNLSLKA